MADNTLFEDLVLINDLRTVLCAHNETIESEEVKLTRGLWKQLRLLKWEAQQFTDIEKYGPKKYFKIVQVNSALLHLKSRKMKKEIFKRLLLKDSQLKFILMDIV